MYRSRLALPVLFGLSSVLLGCGSGLLGQSLNSRNLPERERALAESTDAVFSALEACSKKTKENDIAFEKDCVPILTAQEIMVMTKEVTTTPGAGVVIKADIPNRTLKSVRCNLVAPEDEAAREEFFSKMSEVQKGDLVILRVGQLRTHSLLTSELENCEFVGRGGVA